jgi:hypothetical protein
MGPTHLPKSWKHQIKKLGLSVEDSKALLGRVWAFALKMELTDYAKLDEEWELITQYALTLAKVSLEANDIVLPADLRLACQALSPAVGAHSCSSGPAITEHSQYQLYVNICNRLNSIEAEIEAERSGSGSKSRSIQMLQDELSQIAAEICSQGVKGNNLLKMMEFHRKFQKMVCKKKNAAAGSRQQSSDSGSAVTSKVVLSAMHNIYALARCWCQRVTCQGFNMQRKSSTWSEITNNSIKSRICHAKLMSGKYTLSSFVVDVDGWVHRQCEKAYQGNKMTFKFKSQILREDHVSILQQVLCNGAVSNLLHRVIPRTLQHEFRVESEMSALSSSCSAVQERVQEFMQHYRILDSEVKVFKAMSSEIVLSSPATMQTGSEAVSDIVHESLLEASDLANKNSVKQVVAVYFPSDGHCKIPFFNENRPLGHGIPFFCTCMKHSASGLPCEHQTSWILANRRGSIWTLIYLCHPVFVRGHQVQ